MKKIFIFLIISLLAYNSMAQITISGATTYPAVNRTFNQSSIIPYSNCYIFSDAGTNFYKTTISVPPASGVPGYIIDYYIIRRNNRWFIEAFNFLNSTDPSYYVYYVSQNTSTDINPPCNTIWKIWSGYCVPLGGFGITDTGLTTSTLTLTGYCTCPVSLSPALYSGYIQLPLLDAPSLTGINPPKKGMLTFDMDTHRPKIYDGVQWANLVQDKGNVTLGGSLTAQSINLTGSVTTPVYVPTANFTIDATMHHIFYAGAGGHSCSLPTPIAGREYFITNQGGGVLTFSQGIKTGLSTSISSCVPGITLHIIFDGTQWRLVN